MKTTFSYYFAFGLTILFLKIGVQITATNKTVSSVKKVEQAITNLLPGDTLLIADGVYNNIQLILKKSGKENAPIIIRAKNRGKVVFSGDIKIEMHGTYNVLDGIFFKDGNRNPDEWSTHGPGLVAIYGSHNRITQCSFHAFDQANSAYITTSLTEDGQVPQYCRIDHCSFTEKITFDQVINLNNVAKKDIKKGTQGIPMYHRIDHCYFSNPKKPGNAGGGIRVGYWRSDYGRCLIDNNLFERQDSEPEIITSKSMENVYYNNTYKNCAGTLNFRHGDKQVAINNFFIGTDSMREYGGIFVWGSGHIIANNYFNLPTTLKSRGNAALFLNCGAVGDEHALAFDLRIINNYFDRNNGYAINFSALYERRIKYCSDKGTKFEQPRDILLANNLFTSDKKYTFPLFYRQNKGGRNIDWNDNTALNSSTNFKIKTGIKFDKSKLSDNWQAEFTKHFNHNKSDYTSILYNIEGINLDIPHIVSQGIKGEPLSFEDVGPCWLLEIPGTYAQTGKLSKSLQKKFKEVINKRKK
ncbi:chondroitinase-B domain-containing protein [Carboxylicivirga sp. N1Y90]|uniref:chondroitinase-B domain-containing protein n=1 Tax=Carboxylicivirga fragile TaxID=3417571 RepID=UPI003D3564AD|nr:hypothetical protein [Marinilabiliaceae bacterium N1Y90]